MNTATKRSEAAKKANATRKLNKQAWENAVAEAKAAFVIHPDHDAVMEEVEDINSDYAFTLTGAIQEAESEALLRLNQLADKHGRGLVRMAMDEASYCEFDNPAADLPSLVEYQRGWGDYKEDIMSVPDLTTKAIAKDAKIEVPAGNTALDAYGHFDERGNFVLDGTNS